MKQPDVRITLRLPQDVHEAVSSGAAEDERSLNSQIVFLLRQALKQGEEKKPK